MRKLVVIEFLSVDGVYQAPGIPMTTPRAGSGTVVGSGPTSMTFWAPAPWRVWPPRVPTCSAGRRTRSWPPTGRRHQKTTRTPGI